MIGMAAESIVLRTAITSAIVLSLLLLFLTEIEQRTIRKVHQSAVATAA